MEEVEEGETKEEAIRRRLVHSPDSWMEALIVLKHKVKSFLFSSKMHPWMKRYCMYAGQQDELFHVVEVPLTMMPSNQEKLYGDKSDD